LQNARFMRFFGVFTQNELKKCVWGQKPATRCRFWIKFS
jgi:hypothetical protein